MKLEVIPSETLVDQPVRTVVSGVPLGQRVTLRGSLGNFGGGWHSEATFVAGENGNIDLSSCAPVAGTYEGVDPMGLYWSMDLAPAATDLMMKGQMPALPAVDSPLIEKVELEVDGLVTRSTELKLLFQLPNVVRTPVREDGIAATLFHIPGKPQPGVIVLGGSEGGVSEYTAAVLASHGFTTLALAYFNFEHLPSALCELPLEYFEKAIDWFASHDAVSCDGVGVTGVSKGGELSLLLGVTFSTIRAVVAHVPSGVVMMGIPDISRSSWCYRGKALPFATADTRAAASMYQPDGSVVMRNFYLASIHDEVIVERTTIPVENTKGPIMLISGGDDQAWPSFELSEIAVDRLKRNHFRHPFTHLTYERAGHAIVFPYLPESNATRAFYPFLKFMMVLGGTRKANVNCRRRFMAKGDRVFHGTSRLNAVSLTRRFYSRVLSTVSDDF